VIVNMLIFPVLLVVYYGYTGDLKVTSIALVTYLVGIVYLLQNVKEDRSE
jgi:membrane protein insertase Oxa1/YidC/SpoIIIJ